MTVRDDQFTADMLAESDDPQLRTLLHALDRVYTARLPPRCDATLLRTLRAQGASASVPADQGARLVSLASWSNAVVATPADARQVARRRWVQKLPSLLLAVVALCSGLTAARLTPAGAGPGVGGARGGPVGALQKPPSAPTGPQLLGAGRGSHWVLRVRLAHVSLRTLRALRAVLAARLHVFGVTADGVVVSVGQVDMELPPSTARHQALLKRLLTEHGAFSIHDARGAALLLGSHADAHQYPVLFTERDVRAASVRLDAPATAQTPLLQFSLQTQAARRLAAYTTTHVGDHLPMALDGRVIADPLVMDTIAHGQIQLAGLPSADQARELAAVLRSGPLPAPVVLVAAA